MAELVFFVRALLFFLANPILIQLGAWYLNWQLILFAVFVQLVLHGKSFLQTCLHSGQQEDTISFRFLLPLLRPCRLRGFAPISALLPQGKRLMQTSNNVNLKAVEGLRSGHGVVKGTVRNSSFIEWKNSLHGQEIPALETPLKPAGACVK